MVGSLDRAMAAEDVGDLANEQPQLRELQRDIFETKQRPRFRRMPLEHVGVDFHRGQRHAALDPTIELEELQVHVRGIREFRMVCLDRPQRRRFT